MRSTGKVAGDGRPPAKEMISGRWVIFRLSRIAELCSCCARSENCHWMGLGFSIFILISQEGRLGCVGHYKARWMSELRKRGVPCGPAPELVREHVIQATGLNHPTLHYYATSAMSSISTQVPRGSEATP